MSYLALYRKYRPQTFNEVIGQNHITQTLINQIKNDKIGHAYLFCGSRGTGKTSTAKIFARAINCENPVNGSPCGKCEVCKTQEASNLDIFEIDAASNNRVDEIRDLREKVKYPPVAGKYKVYIIDEVHMLTDSAFNALLKTLEEPPKHVVFILATTEVHKLPATILSRCLRFDFKLISVEDLTLLIEKLLKDSGIEYELPAIKLIARVADGGARDALSITDMCVSYTNGKITYDAVASVVGATDKKDLINFVDKMLSKNIGETLVSLDKILSSGKNPFVFSKDLIEYFRDLLIMITSENCCREMIVSSESVFEEMKKQALEENKNTIIQAIEKLSEIEQELRFSVHPKIALEVAIIKTIKEMSLVSKVLELEKKINSK